ncbi:uncharacterized protein METZ01_LOCUS384342, partial [marine metagenome]
FLMCPLFQDKSFFMQGQMDIHPKSHWDGDDFIKSTGGFYPKNDNENRKIYNLEPWDNTRRDMLILLLRTVADKKIEGDMAELGVHKGFTAKLIHHYMPERKFHLFDTFEGVYGSSFFEENDQTKFSTSTWRFTDTSLIGVKNYITEVNNNIQYYKGYFPKSIPKNLYALRFAFVHLDFDFFEATLEGLKFFYPRMNPMGIIVIHDYNTWPGARMAVDDFFQNKKELPIPLPDKAGSVLIV